MISRVRQDFGFERCTIAYGDGDLLIARLSETRDLADLRSIWNPLLARSRSNTIFLTWEWVTAWWECYGDDKTLYVLLISDRVGKTIAIAPLYIAKQRLFGIPINELRFIGDGSRDSVYLDFITIEGREAESTVAIVNYLEQHRDDWDIAQFNTTPESSPNAGVLCGEAAKRAFIGRCKETVASDVNVPRDWKAYEALMQARFRGRLRSRTRWLTKNYNVEFSECKDGDQLAARLESLFTLHQQRWEARYWAGIFSSSTRRHFYHTLAKSLLKNNWLRLYSLKIDDVFVAHQFYMEYGKTWYWLIDGFDPHFAGLEVGKVLRGHAFREAIFSDIGKFDFLGSITPYKRHWGAQPKKCVHTMLFQKGGRSRVVFETHRIWNALKATVAASVPETANHSIKLVIRRLLAIFGIRVLVLLILLRS